MTEKVKLTPQQAKVLEKERKSWTDDTILQQHVERWYLQQRNHVLDSLHFTTLAKALYIGYEIEEPYKIGDWLYVYVHDFVAKVVEEDSEYTGFDNGRKLSAFQFRKATAEEIAAEKERRKWALLGRKVGEYKGGDIVAIKDELWVVTSVDQEAGFDEIWCQSFGGEISECYSAKDIQALVCPFYNRFDLINI